MRCIRCQGWDMPGIATAGHATPHRVSMGISTICMMGTPTVQAHLAVVTRINRRQTRLWHLLRPQASSMAQCEISTIVGYANF